LCSLRGENGVHERLLDEFIPAVYADAKAELDRKAAEEYEEPKQLPEERWLMILAENMTKGGKTSLEWWDLRGLAPSWRAPALVGAVCGIATGIAAATGTHVSVGIGIGFGASYQFRHTALQERLAAKYRSRRGAPAAEHTAAGTEESETSSTPAGQVQDAS
jgi:hypothetical protein